MRSGDPSLRPARPAIRRATGTASVSPAPWCSATERLLREVIVEFHSGRTFSYEATQFTNALGRLIHGVRGDWTFIEDGTGSIVRWTWEFKPRPFCRLPVQLLLVPVFRNYMKQAIRNAVRLADRS